MFIQKGILVVFCCASWCSTKITYRKEPWRKTQLRLVNWHYALKRLELVPQMLDEAPYQIVEVVFSKLILIVFQPAL